MIATPAADLAAQVRVVPAPIHSRRQRPAHRDDTVTETPSQPPPQQPPPEQPPHVAPRPGRGPAPFAWAPPAARTAAPPGTAVHRPWSPPEWPRRYAADAVLL